MKNRNLRILWMRDAFVAAAASLTSASVLSGYLLHTGMSEEKISFYLAFTPLVNLIVSLLFSGITVRIRQTVRCWSVLCIAMGVLDVGYALLFRMGRGGSAFFPVLMLLGCLLTTATAVRDIFEYKLPCEVMELSTYSLYVSVCGIVGSVFGIAAASVLRLGYGKFDFSAVTCAAYVIAGLCFCGAGIVCRFLKRIDTLPASEPRQKGNGGFRSLLADRSFRLLIVPNLLRGVGMATIPMFTLLAVNAGAIRGTDAATITVCTYLATFISCTVYAFLAPRLRPYRMGIIGAVIFCAAIPSLAAGKTFFFFCYTVAYIGYYVVSVALPDAVYQNVDPQLVSIFHTWRLAFSTVGTTVSTAVIGRLIGKVAPGKILIAAAVTHVLCALAYGIVFAPAKGKRGR